jgi:tellurite resistance protein TerC
MTHIFGYVGVPRRLQHRVLFWGILGALILRGIMIAGGAALIHEFEWLLYVFGGFLIVTGLRMILSGGGAPDVAKNPLLGLLQRLFHFTPELQGHHFFIKHPHPRTGTLVNFATPLFLALVLVEGSDVIFAVDSVPAIFLVTNDPYIIYTSNIFAVLGLRALYFAMAAIVHRFHYLKYAISLILIFIGGKIFAVKLLGLHHIPSAVSLGVTIALLLGGILYSLWRTRRFARNWETVQHGGRIYIVRQRN